MSRFEAAALRAAVRPVKRALLNTLPDSVRVLLRSMRPMVSEQAQSIGAGAAEARRNLGEYRRSRAFLRAIREPVDESLVVWESFGGNGALCSPAALFREVVDAPDLAHLTHVWMIRREVLDAHEGLLAEFSRHPRVRFVEYRSVEYFALLERARWLINNATFPREFIKRVEQTYLNTWHGTPLKHMGYDEPDGVWASRNVLRNFLSADYLLSSGEYMTDRMYRRAYRLAPLFSGTIVEDGYPRTDVQFRQESSASPSGRDTVGDDPLGGSVRGHTLLFAPTWRGASFREAGVEAAVLAKVVGVLKSLPALAGWTIRLKVHQAVYRQVKDDPRLRDSLVPNAESANDLLAQTDLLLTDFSSIFMDALATDIPIVFFATDFDDYLARRGTYVSPSELPGPVTRSLAELADAVTSTVEGTVDPSLAEHYSHARARWVPHEDGGASRRIADLLFRGREDAVRRRVRMNEESAKTKLVLNLGGLKPNGISTSALNLLSQLDRERYDVTAVFPASYTPDRVAVRERIPADIRVLPDESGLMRLPLAASYSRLLDAGTDLPREGELADDALWRLEWTRITGNVAFDVAIDFSGYSAKWVRLMAHTGACRSLLWMHNDLAADCVRSVNDQKPYERTLRAVFGMLSRYDALVSVSEPLRDINRTKLAQYAPAESFLFARNVIDEDTVLRGAGRIAPKAARAVCGRDISITVDSGLDEVVGALLESFGGPQVRRSIEEHVLRQLIRELRGRGPVFCTVGRMSPEKNHDRLLRAFAGVLDREPEAVLVLVGDGPLRSVLEETTAELGIAGSVLFTGQIPHPYAVLDESDCFVLSSDYEGQPMVILEALVLGLPVITTAFGSVRASLPEGTGLIVERDVDALAAAMLDWRAVPHREFDVEAYNAKVMAEFDAVVRL